MALALVSTKDASSIPGKTNGSQNISSTQFPPNGQPKNHCMSRDPFAKPDNLMPIHPRATGANAFPCALYRKYSIGSLSPKNPITFTFQISTGYLSQLSQLSPSPRTYSWAPHLPKISMPDEVGSYPVRPDRLVTV